MLNTSDAAVTCPTAGTKNRARKRHSLQAAVMNPTAVNVTTDDVHMEAPVSSTRQHGVLHYKT